MVKTLFLTQDFPPYPGGIARLYGEVCRRLPRGGVEVCTVAIRDGLSPGDVPPGVPVTRMPFTLRQARLFTHLLAWTRWTFRRLAAGDVALIQAGNIRPTGYIAWWARARRGTPYVIWVHGKDLMKEARKTARRPLARWTARRIFGGAGAVIANSEATARRARALLASLGLPTDGRVRVVHPGTDPVRFRPGAGGAALRQRLALGDAPVLLSVCRLMPRKGIDTVLRALPEVRRARPDLVYLVAGHGPDRARLEGLASERGLGDAVRFLGAVPEDQLPALYDAADLFVLPVRTEEGDDEVEGFGIVFAEAAAAGTPSVAGRAGGAPEAVRDGETGVLVAPDDPAALADALRRLLEDPAERRRLSEGGRRAAESYYTWERTAAEAWRICGDVAAGGAR
ncbi:MAG TPA: glycosyltransferase family 4 protein [Longimicrobiales bacterium]|nr:glycosyltransferase family 4 protein [Longimicrobiales bacterium]